ncbi:hypothetical protein F5B19DRAFT_450060 [Rostrohypoxylon terebratum]|nr:hypothetical protein F5B19DRAFT_450060 [Rostrohypoxylon terebratum]
MALSRAMLRFEADFKSAVDKDYLHITNIRKGDENEIKFVFSHPDLPHPSQIEIHAQPQELRSYPVDNSFLIYTTDDIPPIVAQVLEDSIHKTMGMKVDNMLADLSQRLRDILDSGKPDDIGDATMTDVEADPVADESDADIEDDDDLLFEYDEDEYFDNSNTYPPESLKSSGGAPKATTSTLPLLLLRRLQRDLQSIIKAGFHTGVVYGFKDETPGGIISISIRVNKLCLPKETRQAWGLTPSEYIILLIRYDGYYSDYENVMDKPVEYSKISFRLRKCPKQKPSLKQATMAFTPSTTGESIENEAEISELSNLWISKSMDDFMNREFISILKMRNLHNLSWEKAKEKLMSHIIQFNDRLETFQDVSVDGEEQPNSEVQLQPPLDDDHFLSGGELSFPLIAMQFALYYLVRCTDYCTVCHQKMENNFAALMPYVCTSPLCLHQYMSLGFGPSMDHQIIDHPEVVDLLVSFSYAALCVTPKTPTRIGMRQLPAGLGLRVPKIRSAAYSIPTLAQRLASGSIDYYVGVDSAQFLNPAEVLFDWRLSKVTILGNAPGTFEVGQWVVVSTPVRKRCVGFESDTLLHQARIEAVENKDLLLNVVSQHSIPKRDSAVRLYRDERDVQDNTLSDIAKGYLVPFNDEFDDLEDPVEKAFSLTLLLASMPPVAEMRSYLMSSRQPLAKWGRMSPASINLLRWIIASNRSHIVKVKEGPIDSKSAEQCEKIGGVGGWIQFRFTQGSPEKENLFYQALEDISESPKTLVAWHGSSLENWHSIIREGLDYTQTMNGRSFGHGIYFARDFDTSQGYSNVCYAERMIWPASQLNVEGVVSLNELAFRPREFVSTTPFYVVQHCHWCQCRYLFVRPKKQQRGTGASAGPASIDNTIPQHYNTGGRRDINSEVFVQDPLWEAKGPQGSHLFIPKHALPSMRKVGKGHREQEMLDYELESSDDEEDTRFIWDTEEDAPQSLKCESDFRPGTLDFSSLPQLAPPSYATTAAQRALGQEIKKLESIQSSTPLHLLGWYIDFEKINNLFQWIVEFHSFDPNLPLAKDMKDAGLTSIVLEIRFLRGFPISPPFVRVIRPRFMTFVEGGGGHVTAGGALCMELLTNSGWSPANSMESVLLQVRMAMCSEDPRPARLKMSPNLRQYGVAEAIDAYTRAARTHGWEIPPDLADAGLTE